MPQPKKPLFDPQSKTAKPGQSGKHPVAGSAKESLGKIAKPMSGGPGQTWFNLKKSDVDEYARSHAGGAVGANPGPGLLQKFMGLLKKLTKTP
jgi:hypothetical protein